MISAKDVNELRTQTGAGMMDCKKALTECEGDIEKAIDWLREKGIAKAAKKADRIAAEGLANIYTKDNKACIIEVNCETDFVTKNDEFVSMINDIGAAILNSDAKSLEVVKAFEVNGQTVEEFIVAKTAKIGEKLSLRRFSKVTKTDEENFGAYIHMGGKIAVLTVIKGADETVAKEVAMQSAAMKPLYVFSKDVPADVLDAEKEVQRNIAINEGKPKEIAEKMVEGRIKKYYKEICLADQPFIKNGDISVNEYVTNNGGELISMVRYEVGEGLEKRNENFAEEVMNQIK